MSRPALGTGKRTSSGDSLPGLAERQHLPPRVRVLLEGLLERAATFFERALTATLDEAEQDLFKVAERARSNEAQQYQFEGLREIKRGRADVAPRFLLHLEASLARLDERPIHADGNAAAATKPARASGRPELELVDTHELEERLALQEISSKAEIRHSQPLYSLGHRLGVLAGGPAFDPESMPIGPTAIGQALRHATGCFEIPIEHRVMLYRLFDRVAMSRIGSFFDAENAYLIEQRILPNLQYQAPRHKTDEAAGANAAPANEAPAPEAAPPVPLSPDLSRSRASDWTPRASPPQAPAAAPAQTAPVEPDSRDGELFATLRELLAGRRHALGVNTAPPPDHYHATRDDLQSVLGALQGKPAAPMMLGGKLVPRSVQHLKQDLMTQLRQLSPEGRTPALAEEDSDTVDLVGMLFDFISQNVRPESGTQSLLTKLQVPVMRVALRDKTFFTRRQHPARQLLNTIAETSMHWLDDDDADHGLVEKMQLLVDRVTGEFDGNLGLFETLLDDLSRHMSLLAKRAEVAERRHVDAAKGREKLDLSRERAQTAIARLIKQAPKPSPLVRTLLEQAWTDVLALTLLRQGEHSPVYHRRLAVADQLLRRNTEEGVPQDATLRQEVESGLSQVGVHEEDVQAVLGRLFQTGTSAANDETATPTELAIKLKAKTRLGGDAPPAPPPLKPGEKTIAPPTAAEQQMLERLKTVPFGTWFEFVTNQQGESVRRKLAWFSTVTGRCLFVNQRGARTEERTLDLLARDLVRGQVRFVESEKDSIIDRAWKTIMSKLKSFTSGSADPLPAPA